MRLRREWPSFGLSSNRVGIFWRGSTRRRATKTFEIYTPREWELARYMPARERAERNDRLLCPMPGLVLEIMVTPGRRVYRGQELVVLESMKMQTAVASPCDGIVQTILVGPGDTVETGDVIMTFVL